MKSRDYLFYQIDMVQVLELSWTQFNLTNLKIISTYKYILKAFTKICIYCQVFTIRLLGSKCSILNVKGVLNVQSWIYVYK
jgi:hypothetical protein